MKHIAPYLAAILTVLAAIVWVDANALDVSNPHKTLNLQDGTVLKCLSPEGKYLICLAVPTGNFHVCKPEGARYRCSRKVMNSA